QPPHLLLPAVFSAFSDDPPFMIVLRALQLRRGVKVLFEDASLTFNHGQKIGVTGANGSGKSSLFALLLGELHQDAGDLDIQPGLVVAHVAQETPSTDQLAIEYVLDGDAELRQLERDLAAAEEAHNGTRIAELHEDLHRIGGYAARARAAQLMHGLGFDDTEIERPVEQFSGGWRVRLNLARADVPFGLAAARRTYQPLGPRRDRLARAVALRLSGHAADDFARSRIPR